MAELFERAELDLADAFAGEVVAFGDLFEFVLGVAVEPEAAGEDIAFLLGEGVGHDVVDGGGEQVDAGAIGGEGFLVGRERGAQFDELAGCGQDSCRLGITRQNEVSGPILAGFPWQGYADQYPF